MRIAPFALLSLVLFAGCNSYGLRYQANPQPQGANLFADATPLQDAVGVSVDTDGRRLEEIYIRTGGGTPVRPVAVMYPQFERSAALGTGVGIGTGHVGLGTGIGFPIGPRRASGLTTATFSAAAIGAPPWELHVKVHDIPEAVIPGVGGPATAK